jgi:hypothetical protein
MKTSLKSLALVALVGVSSMSLNAFAQEASTSKKGATAPAATPAAQTAEPQATASKKAKSGPIKTSRITRGTVISLMTLKKVTAAEAGAMANKGALALMVGSRVVYVVKADGTSAGDDLARLADGTVGVAGKTISRGGATVIVADVVDVIK